MITTHDLSKYFNQFKAVDSIKLNVQAGEVLALGDGEVGLVGQVVVTAGDRETSRFESRRGLGGSFLHRSLESFEPLLRFVVQVHGVTMPRPRRVSMAIFHIF